ncbi:MAG: tRNA uridine-5-carboxymethylaminomethyl(34) synthesis GTPase MnmE [Candidatus Cloacimonetes bacterium]|nr:tRNA uridine-5-carboxymethylaminomethyl(34) synthesis GTPase MnmE [Candidatus Cloacimonadota bacterium]
MPPVSEPICALITPPGCAAVSVIRISGTGSIGIVTQFFRPRRKLLNSPSHRAVYGLFYNRNGKPLDQVLCTVFRAPKSYTGEDCVEISCHGNPRLAARILENLLLEARLARPGEFTLRALLNGKLDLTQAEAVNDLISATGSKAETAALMQVRGLLSDRLRELLDGIYDARLRCELAIDFADQDLPPLDAYDLRERVAGLLDAAKAMHSEGSRGRYIREGIRVCLAGAPNSGKSSLFNAFLHFNRAIVTPHPGTTRDYLEESVSLHGYTLVLYDTAGLRESANSIEREGIDRSRELMRQADLVLCLLPVDENHAAAIPGLTPGIAAKTLWLASKWDLVPPKKSTDPCGEERDGGSPERAIPVSVMAPNGMEALYEAILKRFDLPPGDLTSPLVTNARHLAALERSITAISNALSSLENQAGYEFTAFDLIAAANAIGEILGVTADPDLLGRIFADFCIGK